MEFKIGDKVVHPIRGAGVITGIEEQDLLDKYHRYYVIDLLGNSMTLMVPVANAENIGLRPATNSSGLRGVWDTLRMAPTELPSDYKVRQNEIREWLRPGNLLRVAAVVRDMLWRDRQTGLTKADQALLDQAQGFLAGEVALAQGIEPAEAAQQIREVVHQTQES